MVRNTKAFKEAVAQTLTELARRGVTFAPATVEDTIEKNMTMVAERLGIQVRSAWRYFDAAAMAEGLARSRCSYEESSSEKDVGQAPMPPIDNPELALVLAGVPDSLAQSGGDLYAVIINVAVNAWMAGHIHGEDGCTGCDGSRGLGSADAHHHRAPAEHHQVVRPRRMDPRSQRRRLHRHPPLTYGSSVVKTVIKALENRIKLGSGAAQRTQPHPRPLGGVQRPVQRQHRRPGRRLFAVDGVHNAAPTGTAGLRQHPASGTPRPQRLLDGRGRLQVLGGHGVVRDAVHGPHVIRGAHPNPVLGRLHPVARAVAISR